MLTYVKYDLEEKELLQDATRIHYLVAVTRSWIDQIIDDLFIRSYETGPERYKENTSTFQSMQKLLCDLSFEGTRQQTPTKSSRYTIGQFI